MSSTAHLCPHKVNPRTCWTCLQAPPKAAAKAPSAKPTNPQEQQAASIVAQMRARAGLNQPKAEPVAMGEADPAHAPAPLEPPPVAIARPRDPNGARAPLPPVPAAIAAAPARGAIQVQAMESFSYAQNRGSYDGKGIWQPPRRPSVIDRLPTHPNPTGK